MPSIYDVLPESCAAVAAKTGRTSHKVRAPSVRSAAFSAPVARRGPAGSSLQCLRRPPQMCGSSWRAQTRDVQWPLILRKQRLGASRKR
jgi:hypothetical protein